MDFLYIQSETLTSMADAIRQAGGTSEKMTPTEMPERINAIEKSSITITPMEYMSSSISEFNSDAVYVLGNAFMHCYSLQSVNLPNASYIGDSVFYSCRSLQSIGLPNVSYIGYEAFCTCRSLQSINLPNVSYIGYEAFCSCRSLQSVNLPKTSYIGSGAFAYCYNLLSLYLSSTSVCRLYGSNAFHSTPIAGYTVVTGGVYGSIYVPASLYNNYITATNWAVYSSRFVSI